MCSEPSICLSAPITFVPQERMLWICPLLMYIHYLSNVLKADLEADNGIVKLSVEITLIFLLILSKEP